MNFRYVLRQLGLGLLVLGAAVLFVGLWDLYQWVRGDASQSYAVVAQLVSAGISGAIGFFLWFVNRRGDDYLGRREALLIVALTWIVGAAVAGLPYFLWAKLSPRAAADHPFQSFIDCYFESMSGLTTTGASVLGTLPGDIESLPAGLLLWRATTHWLGGIGIVVLFVAVLPSLGVGGKKLVAFEATGPTKAGVKPRIRETARVLGIIYIVMTLALIAALLACGMGLFDAICHAFATISTGGFSTRNASIGDPQYGAAIYIVLTLFMLLSGVNFAIYYQLFRRRHDLIVGDAELRLYLAIIAVASLVVTLNIVNLPVQATSGQRIESASLGDAAQHGVFQVVSLQTTTGFVSADYNFWPFPAQAVLITIMYIGGCAGSTSGGIKVIRVLIAFKVILASIERTFRPNVVRPIKAGRVPIDPDVRLDTVVYVLGILLLSMAGGITLMILETGGPKGDMLTSFTASVATLNNVGPGLAAVGAMENFGGFSQGSKAVMSVLMLLGRIEVYAVLVLLVPRFWRRD